MSCFEIIIIIIIIIGMIGIIEIVHNRHQSKYLNFYIELYSLNRSVRKILFNRIVWVMHHYLKARSRLQVYKIKTPLIQISDKGNRISKKFNGEICH